MQIPTASGDAIEAWVYLPEGSCRHPAVVMAHGIGAIKAVGLVPFGEKLMTPRNGTQRHDYVAARSLLSFSWRRPVRRAASVRVPFLLVVPEADSITPVPAALKVACRAPGAE